MKKAVVFGLALLAFIAGIVSLSYKQPNSQPSAPFTKLSTTITITPAITTAATINPMQVSSDPVPTSTPAPSPTLVPAGSQQVTMPDMSLGIKKAELTASKWSMSPTKITGKVKQILHMEITSTDADYGFALKSLNVNAALTPGKKLVLEIVPDRAGTFTFECTSECDGHTDLGATLTVE